MGNNTKYGIFSVVGMALLVFGLREFSSQQKRDEREKKTLAFYRMRFEEVAKEFIENSDEDTYNKDRWEVIKLMVADGYKVGYAAGFCRETEATYLSYLTDTLATKVKAADGK